ncbi:hypothetical protein [Streptomyces collinus]|uniref:hypothetical protein n=1 Tax=Streptomyces collinus TaxID=42684 RepID=UPI0037CE2E02
MERGRRGGTVVLLGLLPPGEVPLLGTIAVTRELQLRGAFRFDTEFDETIGVLAEGLPVEAIVTHTFSLAEPGPPSTRPTTGPSPPRSCWTCGPMPEP